MSASARLWLTTVWPDGSPKALLEPRSSVALLDVYGGKHNGSTYDAASDSLNTSAVDYGDCSAYMNTTGCGWTAVWSCPGHPIGPLHAGFATEDGSHGFLCCCDRGLDQEGRAPPPFEAEVAVQSGPGSGLQKMVGFGAAMPQGSAKVLHDLKTRNQGLYEQVMRKLFGDGDGEAGINMVRFPIGSCDFSMSWHTWDDTPGDYNLADFAPDSDSELIIEVLRDAKAIQPTLVLLGSPWSPPAWLKAGNQLAALNERNTLKGDNATYNLYAAYLEQVARTMSERGLPLQYMTLQNEPLNGAAQYPGMFLSPGDESRLGRLLQERLQDADFSPKLLAFDHNWEAFDYPNQTMAEGVFAGTAWHCYGKTNMAEAQEALHDAFPHGEIHMTECVGDYGPTCDISKGMDRFGWNHEWDMTLLFLGNAAHWGQSSLKWMTVLDEHCGPSLGGPNPEGMWHGRPLVAVPSNAETLKDIKFNQDYWSLSHMSRFVRPGAQRLLTTGQRQGSLIEAFRDETAGTVTLMAMNTDHAKSLDLTATYGECRLQTRVPEWGTAVLVWPEGSCLTTAAADRSTLEDNVGSLFFGIGTGLALSVALVLCIMEGLLWRRRKCSSDEHFEEAVTILI
jgi:glucosylceramidase